MSPANTRRCFNLGRNNVFDVQITLKRRHNNVVCLLGHFNVRMTSSQHYRRCIDVETTLCACREHPSFGQALFELHLHASFVFISYGLFRLKRKAIGLSVSRCAVATVHFDQSFSLYFNCHEKFCSFGVSLLDIAVNRKRWNQT